MKNSNLLMIFILGTIPEIILAMFLQNIWNTNFIEILLQIYFILMGLGIMRFILGELSFRLFIKQKMIDEIYSMLENERFPNPWNYYIDDGLSYFDEVGRDVNNEMLETKIIHGATTIYTQVKTFYDLNKFGTYWRYKSVLKIAVKRFMDKHFKTNINDLNITSGLLLEKFKYYNFPNPESYIGNSLEYLDFIIGDKSSYLSGKGYAIKIRNMIAIRHSEIVKSESSYDLDQKSERKVLNKMIEEINIAINKYSKEF